MSRRPSAAYLLYATLAVAYLARFLYLGAAEFKFDEALTLWTAERIAAGELVLLGNPGSRGLHNPPLSSYLLALPTALHLGVMGSIAWIALLDVLGVAVALRIGLAVLGVDGAVVLGLLLAVNPWLVLMSHRTQRTGQLLLVSLALLTALAYVARPAGRRAFQMGLAFGSASLLHLQNVLAVPVAVLALFLARARSLRSMGLWTTGFLLLVTPYLWALMATGDAPVVLPDGEPLQQTPTPAQWAAYLLSGHGVSGILAAAAPDYGRAARFLAVLTPWLVGAALLGGLYLASKAVPRRFAAIVLMWAAVPLAVLQPLLREASVHQLMVTVPALFLLLAAGFVLLWRLGSRPLRGTLAATTLGVVLIQLWSGQTLLAASLVRPEASEAFGYPVAAWHRLELEVQRVLQTRPVDSVYVRTMGVRPDNQSVPAALATLIFPRAEATFTDPTLGDAIVLNGRETALYVVTDPPGLHRDGLLSQVGETLVDLPPQGNGLGVQLVLVDGQEVLSFIGSDTQPHADFENGVRFLGARIPVCGAPGGTVHLVAGWQVLSFQDRHAENQLSAFFHLMAGREERIAQADGMGWPSYAWRDGDLILQRFTLQVPSDLPEGVYEIWSGLYRLRDLQRVAARSPDGGAIHSLPLGELRIGEGCPPAP